MQLLSTTLGTGGSFEVTGVSVMATLPSKT